jgi:hypothetical protein
MLTEFGELGFDYSVNWCTNGTVDPSGSCRETPKPIRWDYLQDTSRKKLHDTYAAMMQLRTTYPELATGQTTYSLNGTIKYSEVVSDSLSAVAIGNFDVYTNIGNVSFPNAGTWYDYFSGTTFQATGNAQSFSLAPGEYHLFLSKNVNSIDTTTDTTTTPPDFFQPKPEDISQSRHKHCRHRYLQPAYGCIRHPRRLFRQRTAYGFAGYGQPPGRPIYPGGQPTTCGPRPGCPAAITFWK